MSIVFVVHFGAQTTEAREGWNAQGVGFGT